MKRIVSTIVFVLMLFAGVARTQNHSFTKRYLSIKTNVAAWAVGTMNVAIDVQVAKRLSIEFPLLYSPWHINNRYGIKIFAIQPEGRYWLYKAGERHFVGLHAHVGWFNVKWKRNRYQDSKRPLLGGGVSYGYLLPLGRHWASEFTMGAGYANIFYDTFYNINNGANIDSDTHYYWGITRVGISVTYRF